MDHRCGERHEIGTTVLLRRRGWAGWVVGELENLSVSGAFLKVAPGALPLHAQVRIEAPCPSEGAAVRHSAGEDGGSGTSPTRLMHCTAMVTRVTRAGVGLAFDEMAPPSLAPLFRVLGRNAVPGNRRTA